jgi:hypothetical protein
MPLFPILIFLVILYSSSLEAADNTDSSVDEGLTEAIRYQVTDAHLHYVDFLQNSEGVEALLKAMNRAGVDHAMLNGLPLVKKWNAVDPRKPLYYLGDDSRTYWYSTTDILVAQGWLSVK